MGDAEVFDQPSVQPPTREQIAVLARLRAAVERDSPFGLSVLVMVSDLDAMLALFPQPTPSAEPGVQVPAELIEHVRAAHEALTNAERGTWVRELQTTIHDLSRTKVFEAQRELSAAVAQFPQPTPSAERTYEPCGIHGTDFDDDCGWCWVETTAEPTSIADMAPGTTDSADAKIGRLRKMLREMPATRSTVPLTDVLQAIRDVTPPPATPEEGNRG